MVNAHKIKQDICEIGRRIYDKGFAAANDGNISVRDQRQPGAVHSHNALERVP